MWHPHTFPEHSGRSRRLVAQVIAVRRSGKLGHVVSMLSPASTGPCRSHLGGRQRKFFTIKKRNKKQGDQIVCFDYSGARCVARRTRRLMLCGQLHRVRVPRGSDYCFPRSTEHCKWNISILPLAILKFGFLDLCCPRSGDASSIRASLGQCSSTTNDNSNT